MVCSDDVVQWCSSMPKETRGTATSSTARQPHTAAAELGGCVSTGGMHAVWVHARAQVDE